MTYLQRFGCRVASRVASIPFPHTPSSPTFRVPSVATKDARFQRASIPFFYFGRSGRGNSAEYENATATLNSSGTSGVVIGTVSGSCRIAWSAGYSPTPTNCSFPATNDCQQLSIGGAL